MNVLIYTQDAHKTMWQDAEVNLSSGAYLAICSIDQVRQESEGGRETERQTDRQRERARN